MLSHMHLDSETPEPLDSAAAGLDLSEDLPSGIELYLPCSGVCVLLLSTPEAGVD